MKVVLITAAVAIGLASGAVIAQTDVLKAQGCLGCHDIEKKKVGPSFKDVGAKYKNDKSKAGDIVSKMKDGKGHPKISKSDADLKAAVEAALSVK
jgi:cytochrome c